MAHLLQRVIPSLRTRSLPSRDPRQRARWVLTLCPCDTSRMTGLRQRQAPWIAELQGAASSRSAQTFRKALFCDRRASTFLAHQPTCREGRARPRHGFVVRHHRSIISKRLRHLGFELMLVTLGSFLAVELGADGRKLFHPVEVRPHWRNITRVAQVRIKKSAPRQSRVVDRHARRTRAVVGRARRFADFSAAMPR